MSVSPARILLSSLCASLLSIAAAGAHCLRTGGFSIDQCGDRGFFAPPPEGSGAVSVLFWQVGYGNATINNGEGANGIGIAPPGVFSGIDNGVSKPGVVDARSRLGGDPRVPEGALCLEPLNWANNGIDGCCDNARDPNMINPQDMLLNPYFDPFILRKEGRFVRVADRIQDYPMAVLLKEETSQYFAVAVVAAAARDRENIEDLRAGRFTFAAVQDGEANPLGGEKNVIPWQPTPRPKVTPVPDGRSPAGTERVRAVWDPVKVPSDLSHRPSKAYALDNPGHGVGVADLEPLVAYRVEKAALFPAFVTAEGFVRRELLSWNQVAVVTEPSLEMDLGPDECVRVGALFGKQPTAKGISVSECALAKCGDVGFLVTGPPVCREGPVIRKGGKRADSLAK